MIDIDNFKLNKNNIDLIKHYRIYLLTEKHLSDNSITSYVLDIYKYLNYLENNMVYNPLKISKENIIAYLSYLDNNKYSIYSVVRKLSSIRIFHHYLSKIYNIDDVTLKIDNPRFYKKIPNVLSIEEVDKLLDIKLNNNFDYRNKAMLELCFATGLRVSELVNLKVSDINFNDCYLRVMGKGKKERIVPIDDIALKYVKMYNDYYRNKLLKNKDSEYLFISSYASKITRQAFFKLIKSECAKKGLENEISPHTLRHSFASVLLKTGANIRVIQELLGHEDLKTTQIYTHLINEKLKKDYEEYHPRSRKE